MSEGTPYWQRQILCDPQTSGGLLISCAPGKAEALLKDIVAAGYPAAPIVGEITDGRPLVVVEA